MGKSGRGIGLDILTFTQLEAQGAQAISASQLIFEHKKFRLGPAFAKRCHKAALDFCRIVRADCLLIDHENYLGIWLHYQKKQAKPKPEEKPKALHNPIDELLAGPVDDTEIVQLFESALPEQMQVQTPQELAPEFIKTVQNTLIEVIGPIGQLVTQQALREPEDLSPTEFIQHLAQSIPDPEKAQIFLIKFFPR